VLQKLIADAGRDLIAFSNWRRRNSLTVNMFLTTPNVRVRRNVVSVFAMAARSAGRSAATGGLT
jgi:hypothetical protein